MLPNFDNTEIAFKYRSNKALSRASFLFSSMASPWLAKLGMDFTQFAFKYSLPIKWAVKETIFRQFCGGEDLAETVLAVNTIAAYGVRTILDYSVEGKDDEAEFDHGVIELKKTIASAVAQKPNVPFVSVKPTGFGRFALLERWHDGAPLSEAEQTEKERVIARIDAICKEAAAHQIGVLIDAEESWIQNAVDDLANTMMARYNNTRAIVYNTFQLYCQSRLDYLKKSFALAQTKEFILGAKLVRGAYMEKERARAAEKGYPSPIQINKEATDRDYDAAVQFCLEHLDRIWLFLGSHNEDSNAKGASYLAANGIEVNTEKVWFSQLYGMSDNISFNLAHAGYNVAKYMPFGPVKDVVPYLMRRAQENTSVAGQTGRELALIQKERQRRRSA